MDGPQASTRTGTHDTDIPPWSERWKFVRRRIRARVIRLWYGSHLSETKRFALFIGYPRSGHTLIAALLDAHPNMVFANGLDAAHYVQHGFTMHEIAALAIWNSKRFARHGRRSNGYGYAVPDGWHGEWAKLQVVGDKSGDLFSARLRKMPELLPQVLEQLGGCARFIHVVRNPFDCISTIAARNCVALRTAAAEFLQHCDANQWARCLVPAHSWCDLNLEDVTANPGIQLRKLGAFLGVEMDDLHIARCRRLVWAAPVESRHVAGWTTPLIDEVGARLQSYAWFKHYQF